MVQSLSTSTKFDTAYDESRDPTKSEIENFAAVLRSQTSRLLNLKACNKGRRVLRGNLVSASLHVLADKPFYTRYPPGHPDEFLNGVRQAMKWRKLLYGKGNASRGLWHDMAACLLSLGFTQEFWQCTSVCLCTARKGRLISVCTSTTSKRRQMTNS